MIRRQLRKLLPALAHWYGIMPWHLHPDPAVLTFGELEEFVRQTPKQD